ncbi:MAG: porin [Chlorobi bacterium]|nr:porin [Chlorobiota bacterium]
MKVFQVIILVFILSYKGIAQEDTSAVDLIKNSNDSLKHLMARNNNPSKIDISYGSRGWVLEFNNKFMMQVQWRMQFRFESQSEEPLFFIPEEDALDGSFNIQRARLKVGGYAYKPYNKYYLEYDFPSGYLLNWEFTFARLKYLQFKLGQWKIHYNTERYISSGKQQFVERSVSNRFFTVDRQIGIMIKGDLFEGKAASGSYNLGLFNGNGRMVQNDDGKFLWFARYQWNFSRHPIEMSYCDIDRVTKPQGFLAFAYVHNESAYTGFSSEGGGVLPGYIIGEKLQYLINQYNAEFMLKYRGFSFTSENHVKKINDRKEEQISRLYGGYYQAGYFPGEAVKFIPGPLEFIIRYAYVSNDTFFDYNINEYSFGFNWFFKGHLNKLSADFSYIENQDFVSRENNYRFRIQWDVSF